MDIHDHIIRGFEKTNKSDGIRTKTIHIGEVIDNNDPTDTYRVKCKIAGLDDTISSDDNRLWCNFFGFKGSSVIPKIGEAVYVILGDVSYPLEYRFWTGPVIGDLQNMEFENHITSRTNQTGAVLQGNKPMSTVPNSDKTFPVTRADDLNDTKVLGRYGSDLLLPRNKFRLRANKNNSDLTINNVNPVIAEGGINKDSDTSYHALMADMLVLLSRAEGSAKLTGNNHEITESDIQNIKENGFTTLRAEPTVELLKLMIKFMFEHIHPYGGKEPLLNLDLPKKIANFDFETIKNKGIKIN
jgi:hypothetical protein